MPRAKKAKLFYLEANLRNDGNIELNVESVSPEDLHRSLDLNMPEYEGTHSAVSLLRYLKSVGDEVLERSRTYIS